MKRISIVGTSGSGKTTMAKALSAALGIPHIELDGLNWLPEWRQRDPDEFGLLVDQKLTLDAWVMEGNYSRIRERVWDRATMVIWINLPFRVVFTRMVVRIFKRCLTREVLWSGNRETLCKHFFTRDSMLYWVIKTYHRRKREYPILLRDARFGHAEKVELKSQNEVDGFMRAIKSGIGMSK